MWMSALSMPAVSNPSPLERKRSHRSLLAPRGRAGFTMIELMVVVAIIVVAAGMMAPNISEFLQNRKIEGVRGTFGSVFNRARLRAVNQRARVSLVFFQEGVRIYDDDLRRFLSDDLFRPETSPMALNPETGDVGVWLEFGFIEGRTSVELPPFRVWARKQRQALSANDKSKSEELEDLSDDDLEYDVSALPRVTFERDGTLLFPLGTDVSTSEYTREIPRTADVMIKQRGNTTVCFIDFRLTGQVRTRTVPMESAPKVPVAGTAEDSQDSKKRSRRKRGK